MLALATTIARSALKPRASSFGSQLRSGSTFSAAATTTTTTSSSSSSSVSGASSTLTRATPSSSSPASSSSAAAPITTAASPPSTPATAAMPESASASSSSAAAATKWIQENGRIYSRNRKYHSPAPRTSQRSIMLAAFAPGKWNNSRKYSVGKSAEGARRRVANAAAPPSGTIGRATQTAAAAAMAAKKNLAC